MFVCESKNSFVFLICLVDDGMEKEKGEGGIYKKAWLHGILKPNN